MTWSILETLALVINLRSNKLHKVPSAMNQVESWYKQLPIITRSYMTACCLTTLAVHLDIIGLMDIYLNFQLVSQRLEVNTRILDGEIETNSYSESYGDL